MIEVGSRVTLKDTKYTTGWAGLTATVVKLREDGDALVQLDDGLSRPDGHTLMEFGWPLASLDEIGSAPRIAELEDRLSRATTELSDFKARVEEVAVRYAVEHGWCSVVGDALEELGLNATRSVQIRVSGHATVEVPLGAPLVSESWVTLKLELDSDFDGREIEIEGATVAEV